MKLQAIVPSVLKSFQQNLAKLVEKVGPAGFEPARFKDFLGGLKAAVNEAGRQALQSSIAACEQERPGVERDGFLYRFKMVSEKEWLTPFGKIVIARRLYQPDGGGTCLVPLDEACGMVERYMTPDVEEISAFAAALLVPDEVHTLLGKVLPQAPSTTAIDGVVEEVGSWAEAHEGEITRALEAQAPLASGKDVLAVSWDGTNVPLREEAPMRGRPAERPGVRKADRAPTAWKEAGVGTISLYARPRKGEKERRRLDTLYFARMPEEGMEHLIRQQSESVERLLKERSFRARVLICDGKPAIWKAAARQNVYDGFVRILDFYHATEALSKAAEALFGKQTERALRWYEKYRKKMRDRRGGAEAVLRSMRYHAKKVRENSERGRTLGKQIRYVARNLHRMEYAKYRRRGLPIGSAPVEAACKTVVGQRLKRSGMRWSRPGGQQVLNLRVHALSERWDPFWAAYQARAA